jgi:hypothetical protein
MTQRSAANRDRARITPPNRPRFDRRRSDPGSDRPPGASGGRLSLTIILIVLLWLPIWLGIMSFAIATETNADTNIPRLFLLSETSSRVNNDPLTKVHDIAVVSRGPYGVTYGARTNALAGLGELIFDNLWHAVLSLPVKERATIIGRKLVNANSGPFNAFRIQFDPDGKGKRLVLATVLAPLDKDVVSPEEAHPAVPG